jgi:hypothetical protein
VQPTAERLRAALSALTVAVEDASCRCAEIALPGYPDGNRPTGVVTLAAGEARGAGEHVAFTVGEQRAFRDEVVSRVPRGRGRLDAFVAAIRALTAKPYERAALEAAAIDLALRQARTNCSRLLAVEPRPARYVLSFGATPDPLAADAAVATAADVEAAAATAAAVNLKPARMGGVLEALDAAARCAELGRDVYFGGMWEVGPGRQQLRVLATLVAPDAPNDIAPLTQTGTRPPRLRIDPRAVGFTGGVGA